MKKFTTTMLIMAILFASTLPVSAMENVTTFKTQEGKEVKVTISESRNNEIPDDIIQDIIDENPEGCNFKITKVINKSEFRPEFDFGPQSISQTVPDNQHSTDLILPILPPNYSLFSYPVSDPVLEYTDTYVLVDTHFITSVAKGSTKTIEEGFKFECTASASGPVKVAKLGIEVNTSYTITKGQTFDGPEEPGMNCKIYKAKEYISEGTYYQWWQKAFRTIGILEKKTGTFEEPESYYEYSFEKYVQD